MPDALTIEMPDFQELLRDISADKIQQSFRPAMRDCLAWLEASAKGYAPVDRGQLRASITTGITGHGLNLTGKVGPHRDPYDRVMEFGANPFWPNITAIANWVSRVIQPPANMVDSVAFLVARKISKKGIAARKYMQNALDDNKARIFARFNRALNEAVSRMAD